MSSFDAGSIVATLDVDRDPFTHGLDIAKMQAEEFEHRRYKTSVDVDVDSSKMGDVGDEHVRVDADTEEANLKLDEVERKKREVGGKTIVDVVADVAPALVPLAGVLGLLMEIRKAWKARVEVEGAGKAEAEVTGLRAGLDGLSGPLSDLKTHAAAAWGEFDKIGGLFTKGGTLITGAVGLASAVEPIVGWATQFAGGAVAGVAALGIGVGLFAKVASGALEDMQTKLKAANGDVSKLHGQTKEMAEGFLDMQKSMEKLQKDSAVTGVLSSGMFLLSELLDKARPMLHDVALGVQSVESALADATTKGHGFSDFLKEVGGTAEHILKDLGPTLVNFGSAFGALFKVFAPVADLMADGLKKISAEVNTWAQSFAKSGVQSFFAYVKEEGPKVMDFLGSVFQLIGNLGTGLAPAADDAMNFLDQLGHSLNDLVKGSLGPLAQAGSVVLKTLQPLLPVIADIANTVIPPLAKALSHLVETGFGPVIQEIQSNFVPAFKKLKPILDDFLPVLTDLFAAPASATTTAGVWKLLSGVLDDLGGVLKALEPIIKTVAGVIGDLVQNALDDLGDILPHIEKAFKSTSGALKPFEEGIKQIEAPIKALLGFAKSLIEGVFDALAKILPHITPLLSKVGDIFKEIWKNIEPLIKPLEKVVNNILGDLADILNPIIDGAGRLLKALQPLFGFLAKTAGDDVQAVLDVLQGLLDFITGKDPSAAFKDFQKRFQDMGDQLVNIGKYIWDLVSTSLVNMFKNMVDDAIKFGKAIWEGLKSAGVGAWDAVSGWFKDRAHDVVKFFSDIVDDVKHVGRDIMNGLWDGLTGVWRSISGWLSDRAHDIEKVLRMASETQSPSRMTHRVGRDIFAGLGTGMDEEWKQNLVPKMTRYASMIKDYMGAPRLSASSRISMAAEVTIANLAQMNSLLASKLDKLTQVTAALPKATGQEVSNGVGQAFDKTTNKANRLAITTARKAGS